MIMEKDVRQWLKKSWSGWIETYEHGRGGGVGVPDVQVLVGKWIMPIELKIGVLEGEKVFINEVRPEQVRWHSNFIVNGGRSLFGVGVPSQLGFDFIIFDSGIVVKSWRSGLHQRVGDIVGHGPKLDPELDRKLTNQITLRLLGR